METYRAFEAERATRAPLPPLSTLAILDIARLFREQPDDALRLADESRMAFEAGRMGRR